MIPENEVPGPPLGLPLANPGFGPWADPGPRRRGAVVALAAALLVLLVDVGWSVTGILYVEGVLAAPHDAFFGHYDRIASGLVAACIVALLFGGLLFIRWQRLAIRNTKFLGNESPELSPGLATICWFLPIVCLFMPLRSLREVARWSRPPGAPPAAFLLGWWWGLWLTYSLASFGLAVLYLLPEGAVPWSITTAADASITLFLLGAGVLAIKVVRTLSAWQQRSATALVSPHAALPP